jgi:hypothetical protein
MAIARVFLSALILMFGYSLAPAQITSSKSKPLVRVDVNTVFVGASVTDKKNRAASFSIFENSFNQYGITSKNLFSPY